MGGCEGGEEESSLILNQKKRLEFNALFSNLFKSENVKFCKYN